MTDDRALIVRAVEGDADAVEQLAALHRPAVFRIARHILGDAEQAEDAAQDVFIRLHAALPGFRGDSELGTWLYRITLNICRDHLRSRRRRRIDPAGLDQSRVPATAISRPDPVSSIDAARSRDVVRAAIDRLPDDQREVVLLRFVSDLSYAEIARITALPPGTVASRIFRALRKLGDDLEPHHLELIT